MAWKTSAQHASDYFVLTQKLQSHAASNQPKN
jgi:hypothetical protein